MVRDSVLIATFTFTVFSSVSRHQKHRCTGNGHQRENQKLLHCQLKCKEILRYTIHHVREQCRACKPFSAELFYMEIEIRRAVYGVLKADNTDAYRWVIYLWQVITVGLDCYLLTTMTQCWLRLVAQKAAKISFSQQWLGAWSVR